VLITTSDARLPWSRRRVGSAEPRALL